MAANFTDKEFGTVALTRSAKASHIRIKIGVDGQLKASLPLYAPVLLAKRLLNSSRPEIRNMLESHRKTSAFSDGADIGKSHHLVVRPTSSSECTVHRHGQQIIVSLPTGKNLGDIDVQSAIRPVVIAALRKEAKSYLPRRLSFLARQHGFTYQKVRFSHASGRWGSCSTSGTISLNIALMKLPFELIDYVLLHELSHTKEMNHSSAFWSQLQECDPHYKTHRREMKKHTPSI